MAIGPELFVSADLLEVGPQRLQRRGTRMLVASRGGVFGPAKEFPQMWADFRDCLKFSNWEISGMNRVIERAVVSFLAGEVEGASVSNV